MKSTKKFWILGLMICLCTAIAVIIACVSVAASEESSSNATPAEESGEDSVADAVVLPETDVLETELSEEPIAAETLVFTQKVTEELAEQAKNGTDELIEVIAYFYSGYNEEELYATLYDITGLTYEDVYTTQGCTPTREQLEQYKQIRLDIIYSAIAAQTEAVLCRLFDVESSVEIDPERGVNVLKSPVAVLSLTPAEIAELGTYREIYQLDLNKPVEALEFIESYE